MRERLRAAPHEHAVGVVFDVVYWVAEEERKASSKNLHGEVVERRASAMEISPESCAEVDAEHGPPGREVLRRRCGQPACDRHDELQALRVEVNRLGRLVEAVINARRRPAQAEPPLGSAMIQASS